MVPSPKKEVEAGFFQARVVVGGVADLGPVEREVLLEEEADVARRVGEVRDLDLADVDVAVEVDDVVAVEADLQARLR